jgi:alpha-L-fucosidase 2
VLRSGLLTAAELELRYDTPAENWERQALPLGNGRLGAMVFGQAHEERIALNEDTLWSGAPRDWDNHEGAQYLPEIRRLVLARRFGEAARLVRHLQGAFSQSYQPLGNLRLSFPSDEGVITDYERTLDISNAVATVRYKQNGNQLQRTMFVSHPDQVLVIQLESARAGGLSFSVALDSLHVHDVRTAGGDLVMSGHVPVHVEPNYRGDRRDAIVQQDAQGRTGMRFVGRLRIRHDGGQLDEVDSQFRVTGADRATLLFAADTSFDGVHQHPAETEVDPGLQPQNDLEAASNYEDQQLLARHRQDYRSLFDRVEFELPGEAPSLTTAERLESLRKGTSDRQLSALFFQFGRYLLISSSRPGTQPANLQGIWSETLRPPWSANYTVNINTQMNYWLAEPTNLSECHEPLLRMVRELSETGSRTAKTTYGMRGWVAHHNVDLWRLSCAVGDFGEGDPRWANWQLGGAWLCQHLWEHYQFTQDAEFLRNDAYPVMKGAALFLLDTLVEDDDGRLVIVPSTSPENTFRWQGEEESVSMASTADQSITWDLFTNMIEASQILRTDAELRQTLIDSRERLYPLKVAPEGYLQEWFEDFEEVDPQHRHASHLIGLHPGRQISPRTSPGFAAAAKKTLERRGDGGTGWSKAWKICFWARLLDGDHAHKMLTEALANNTYDNLLDAHPPFQIDGNFGATAGITEMLLQSHLGEIDLLPALPSAWPQGRISGLKARRDVEVSLAWQDGQLQSALLKSETPQTVRVRYRDRTTNVELPGGKAVELAHRIQ